jgi:hypothetical protein
MHKHVRRKPRLADNSATLGMLKNRLPWGDAEKLEAFVLRLAD